MTFKVTGYTELLTALKTMPKDVRKGIRQELRAVGEIVRADGEDRFGKYSDKTAQGFRVVVRQRGVAVEQSEKKTTGLRPDWGSTQMRRGLVPALEEKQDAIKEGIEMKVEAVAAAHGFEVTRA